jgi:hypothetical protein
MLVDENKSIQRDKLIPQGRRKIRKASYLRSQSKKVSEK